MHHARGVLRLSAAARGRVRQGDRDVRAESAATDAAHAAAAAHADAPDGRALPETAEGGRGGRTAPGEGGGGGSADDERADAGVREGVLRPATAPERRTDRGTAIPSKPFVNLITQERSTTTSKTHVPNCLLN